MKARTLLVIAMLCTSLTNLLCQVEIYCSPLSVESKEKLSKFYQDKIIHTPFTDTDSLLSILNEWESEVGTIEPIERIKILIEISESSFNSSDNTQYYYHYITVYKNRVNSARNELHEIKYLESKSYFDYVVLNSKLDNWTAQIANKLLSTTREASDEQLLCYLLSNNLDEFEYRLRQHNNETSTLYKIYVNSAHFHRRSEGYRKLYLGYWIPLGQLKNDFRSSYSLGVSFGMPIKFKYRIEGKFQFIFNRRGAVLDFKFNDDNISTDNLNVLTAGFKASRVSRISKDYRVDFSTEVNLGVLSTGISDDDDNFLSAETIDLGLGIGLKRLIGNNKGLGLECVIHYAPYGINPSLLSDIGSLYLSTNIFFSF